MANINTLAFLRNRDDSYIREYYYRNDDLYDKWNEKSKKYKGSLKQRCIAEANKYKTRVNRAKKIIRERGIWY